jgi:hypothetical protein
MADAKPIADVIAEKAWGEGSEVSILRRWIKLSPEAKGCTRVIKSHEGSAHDFLLLNRLGFPLCYVEIKRRRTPFSKFGDAIFPMTKCGHAKRIAREVGTPFVGVTEYGCGTLVEVNLTKVPASKRDIGRRDRPHIAPVPHAIYSKRQVTVLEGVTK